MNQSWMIYDGKAKTINGVIYNEATSSSIHVKQFEDERIEELLCTPTGDYFMVFRNERERDYVTGEEKRFDVMAVVSAHRAYLWAIKHCPEKVPVVFEGKLKSVGVETTATLRMDTAMRAVLQGYADEKHWTFSKYVQRVLWDHVVRQEISRL